MQRRKLLKTIAAGGALSLGMSSSAGAVQVDVADLDELKVVRDGDVVERVENPTDEEFRRLDAMTVGDDIMLDVKDCSTYCKKDCNTVCEGTCYYTHTCADTPYCC